MQAKARVLIGAVTALALAPPAGAVPDPSRSTVPPFIVVSGTVVHGAQPDPFGQATVTVRDFVNEPRPGVTVYVDFSGCCDIELCSAVVDGQVVDCENGVVSGVTNSAGQFTFTVLGAANDPGTVRLPGNHGGCGRDGVQISMDDGTGRILLGTSTAVCLDQNGAAGRSNGTTAGDVSTLVALWGSVSLGAPYRGRGDINASGFLGAADVAALIAHVGRLYTLDGAGCPTSFCPRTACP